MNSKRLFVYSVLAVTIVLAAIGLRGVWAQDNYTPPAHVEVVVPTTPPPPTAPETTGPWPPSSGVKVRVDAEEVRAEEARHQLNHMRTAAGISVGNSPNTDIRRAAEKLRDAPDEKAQIEAKQKLIAVLSKCFDEDMARREKELQKLKERLNKLAAQLERRREKKQEIIALQLQVVRNEADGLGFTTRPTDAFVGEWNATSDGPGAFFSNGTMSFTAPTPVQIVAPAPAPQPDVQPGSSADAGADVFAPAAN